MNSPKNNDSGVPKRHAPGWVQQEAARTLRYSGAQPVRIEEPSDLFATLVPTRNQKALMGYYFTVFSVIPMIGLGLGPIAIWHGFRGLGAIKENADLPRHCSHHPWEHHHHRALADTIVRTILVAGS